jgi:type VI secretion system protein ImpF
MARLEQQEGFLPSILDRLIDPESGGTEARRGYTVRQMVDSVRRDLEELLNTRQSHQGLPEEFVEVSQSIVTYGLPDFSSIDASEASQKKDMGELIEAIVSLFEPRLRDVRAVPVSSHDDDERKVRFYIEARLRMDPNPEVAFETIVELMSGHTLIKERDIERE